MSSNTWSFRRRTIGRAASPPTWACYEQIHYDDSDSCSDDISCSEDDDDYSAFRERADEESDQEERSPATPPTGPDSGDAQAMDMHLDHDPTDEDGNKANEESLESKKDIKGKQKAVEVEPETPQRRHRRKPRRSADCALRPILTIHKSQGFVWNQVCLFIVLNMSFLLIKI
jgi:hypothetical protein